MRFWELHVFGNYMSLMVLVTFWKFFFNPEIGRGAPKDVQDLFIDVIERSDVPFRTRYARRIARQVFVLRVRLRDSKLGVFRSRPETVKLLKNLKLHGKVFVRARVEQKRFSGGSLVEIAVFFIVGFSNDGVLLGGGRC